MLDVIVIAAAAVHILLLAAAIAAGRARDRRLDPAALLFCFLVPVFGPVCGLELVFSKDPDPALLKDMIASDERLRRSYIAPEPEASTTAPLEEAFIISEPQVRREMMMKLLYTDADENLELLMIARYNDDPETAHYATATLTEYQRKTELTLQQSQMLLARQPDSLEDRLTYIGQIRSYIDSGLLEGHLLNRQRTLLARELDLLPEEALDVDLGCLRAKNLLDLGQAPEAVEAARQLIRRFPTVEDPWLELMRIYVDCQDAHGLKSLKAELRDADVLWSYQGLEKLEYFLEGVE